MKRLLPFFVGLASLFITSATSAQWVAITNAPFTTASYGSTSVTVTHTSGTTGGGCGGYYWTPGTNSSYTFTFSQAVPAVKFTCDALNYGESITFYVNGVITPLNTCNLDPTPFVNSCSNGNCNIVGNTFVHNIVGQWTCGGVITFYGSITSVMVVETVGGSGTTYDVDFAQPGTTVPGPGGTLTASANAVTCGQTLNLTAGGMTGVTSYSWTGPNGFTSTLQNPSITNVSSLQSGTYTVTAQTSCGPVTASVTVTITTPSPPVVTTPVNYCQGQSSAALTATGQNLLWYTTQTGGTGSSIAPIPSTSTPGTFTWWVSQTINGCESARAPITVNVIAVPTTPVISSNSPLCAGQTLNLTSNVFVGGQYSWTGPGGFTSSFQNPSIGNAQTSNSGTYTLTVNVGGCVSQPASTTVTVSPLPTLTGASAQNPTTCGGTNGQITLNGLAANTTYSITYTLNGTPQGPFTLTSNGFGQIVITGLGAGSYGSLVAAVGNCSSNSIGPINLTGPTPPNINVSVVNATNCNNPNGSLTISGLSNGSYTVNYSYNGNPMGPLTLTASGGQIIITGLAPGTYSGINVMTSTTNCTSNTAGPINIGGPVAPNITLTQTGPTTCGGTNGYITISGTGVTTGSSYVIGYSMNGNPQANITQTGSSNTLTIPNLAAGTYSNITVTIQGCTSNIAGPITITDPSAPVVTIGSNSAICAGQALNLTSTSSITNSTYSWTGPNGFTSTQQNPTINNATTAASGTYTVSVSAGSCSTTMTTPVTVNPSPTVQSAASNSPVCQGNTINLSATTVATGTLTWNWSGPGGYTSTSQNPAISNAGTTNGGAYNVTVTANGCTSPAYPVNVTVIATPAITATSQNPAACGSNSGSITLSGLAPGSYIINYDKNGTPQAPLTQTAGGGSVTINSLTAGTYNNITVSLNGCPSNIVGPITLSDPTQPPTPVLTSGGPYCEGDNVQITVGNIPGATWTWSGPGGFSGTTQNAAINNIQTSQGGTYTLVATVNGCASQPATAAIVVNPIPAQPTITTNSPVCEGATLTMGAGTLPGVSYSWSGPNNFISSNQSETISNAQPTMNGVYTVTVSNGTCSNTNTVNIAVNPTPAAPVVVDPTELCQFEQTTLTAQGQNLLWYTQAVGGTPVTTVTPPTTTVTQMIWWVSQTVNGCEGPRVPMTVIVKPQPQAPTAQTTYTYCQYDPNPTQLTATGTNLQWYDVATGGTPLAGAPTPNTNIPGVFHYFVSQTDSGCESNRTDIEVTIHAKPDLPVVEQITVCQDDPAPALNVQGQNLLWYTTATGGTGSPNNPTISTTDTGITDYYISQTINGCEGDRALLRVTVNPKVVAAIDVSTDKACVGKPITVTFTGIAPSSANYAWDFDGAPDVTGTGAGPYTVEWGTEGDKTITLTVTNLNCSSTTSKVIDVDPTPKAEFDLPSDLCINEEVRVEADHLLYNLPGFTWNFGDAQVMEGTGYGPYRLKWSSTGQKTVSLTLTGINCPSDPFERTVSIHQPEAKVESVSNNSICTSDSVLFTAQPGLDYTYQWEPAAFFKDGKTSGMSAWGTIRKTGYVYLIVNDRWGCEAMDSTLITAKVCCEVFLPNAFTPNGDGKNDVFRMVTKGNQRIAVFQIMDRWGKRVFETADQAEGWDGTFNGEAQDIATYHYYLRYQCADSEEDIEMKGDVMLIR